jgi:hypothetical protein
MRADGQAAQQVSDPRAQSSFVYDAFIRNAGIRLERYGWSRSALASRKSGVSNPSVNQP